ncbi:MULTISPECIES: acetyl-CoA carboxylase biotin carboxyl carrier protein [unclassified Aureimonas]|uniref:acetyl-CoA carboxylase biotin carboxyl carrier protein n=1 Tax=unclassified Aureimonas TaxID=2615206 RepID=UPI0006FC69D7|nr:MULTISPECIES: acetyl-CoA carboxylase biotin carboxyl carrier protein [unclassified Aureimonas]KQT60417.1 acetyl-CoA carboxylase biotin carboxyl carrier protein subunit [Aureimonas sp. Leaf427]KQT79295.1 acetyl-CoA carboxylase biotin carboxyl carrier protein subunit [Aureimonas sp. Leaf460]
MSQNDTPIDRSLVRELADILNDTDLTEIEVEQGSLRVRVSRQKEFTGYAQQIPMGYPMQQAPYGAAPQGGPVAAPAAAPVPSGPEVGSVPSPMVGTVYLASGPDAKPYVEIGQQVAEGETILIIEAMKTMNQIPAPRAGTIKKILVDNAQPVEYGEPLVVIG